MPAPSTPPFPWDTNGTNMASTVGSSHQTDGYAIDEIPTSTELNKLLSNWSEWLIYLSTPVPTWCWIPPAGVLGQPVAHGAQIEVSLTDLKAGDIITGIGVCFAGSNPSTMIAQLYVTDPVSGLALLLETSGTFTNSTSGGFGGANSPEAFKYTFASPGPVVDGLCYSIFLTNTTGSTSVEVYSAGVLKVQANPWE